MAWGSPAEVLDPRSALRADDMATDPVEAGSARVEDQPDGLDWDDPESWYDEGGSG
jgi:hypothetical protein